MNPWRFNWASSKLMTDVPMDFNRIWRSINLEGLEDLLSLLKVKLMWIGDSLISWKNTGEELWTTSISFQLLVTMGRFWVYLASDRLLAKVLRLSSSSSSTLIVSGSTSITSLLIKMQFLAWESKSRSKLRVNSLFFWSFLILKCSVGVITTG